MNDLYENIETTRNKKWPQYLTTLSTVIVSFIAGIHYGWPTPSLPKLLSSENSLNITSDEGSYVIMVASLGDIVGNIVFTILADAIGRKRTILLIALPQTLSMLILHYPRSLPLICFARFLGGIAEGACLCVIPIYLAEISDPEIRGVLMSFFSITWTSGCLFINIVGSYYTIERTSLITLIFPVLFLVSFIFVPESPYFCLMKNRSVDARNALRKLRCNDHVEKELVKLTNDVRRQMSEKGRYQDLFLIKPNRRALVIVLAVNAVCEFTGISSLSFYAQLFFSRTVHFLPGSWAASLIIFLQLIFSIISSFTVDYMGRRLLLLSSIAGCGLSLTFLSFYFFLDDYSSLEVTDFNWLPLAAFIVFVAFFNFGIANIVNCLTGELFSASVKTKAACVIANVYAVYVVVVTKIYQSLSDRYSLAVPLTVFAIAQLLGWGYCWRFVPETKGKSLEEIQQEIRGGYVKDGGKDKYGESCLQPLLS